MTEIFEAKELLKAKMQWLLSAKAPPSYHKNLLKELDVATDNSAISKHQWAKDLHRQTENRPSRLARRSFNKGMRAPGVPERRRGRAAPPGDAGSSKTNPQFSHQRHAAPTAERLSSSNHLPDQATSVSTRRAGKMFSLDGQIPRSA